MSESTPNISFSMCCTPARPAKSFLVSGLGKMFSDVVV